MTGSKLSPMDLSARGFLAAFLLCWAGAAQGHSCAGLYSAIKIEARDCGFFCNQARLKPLQEAYSASCIHVVLPLSPFDLDSIPQDAALHGGNDRTDVGAALFDLRR